METVRVFVRFRSAEKGDLAPWKFTPYSASLEAKPHEYSFDRVFPREAGQEEVYEITSKPLLLAL
jgi:hypothetical protein